MLVLGVLVPVIQRLVQHQNRAGLDSPHARWVYARFRGGHRPCVPLVGGGGFLGALSEAAGLVGAAPLAVPRRWQSGGVAAAVAAPLVLGKAYSGLVDLQRPWLDYRIRETQMARAGGLLQPPTRRDDPAVPVV